MKQRRWLALGLLWAGSCGTEPEDEGATIAWAAATAGTTNVLSAVVRALVRGADSVALRFGDAAGELARRTPAVQIADGTIEIPVFGLEPDATYDIELVAWRGSRARTAEAGRIRTGSLPDELPRYQADGPNPSPGFVIFAAGRYLIAIDNTGRVVWYHRLSGASLNFMAQPNGRFVAKPATPEPGDVEPWVEFDALGQVTRTITCANGLTPRPHDMIALPDGSVWLLCDEARSLDLRALGGLEPARVTATTVQHVGPGGELRFQWSPFDHFSLAELDPKSLLASDINWTHGNALALGGNGMLAVSFRNLSEVTGIDTRTGAVAWRLGGPRNEFSWNGVTPPAFARQHGLRLVDGDLVLLDNLGDPSASRVERYRLDLDRRIATLVRAYEPGARVIAELGGTTQALPDGHTLVSFGSGARVEEYDASGRLVWQILGNPGYVFRAQRIESLYAPAVAHR